MYHCASSSLGRASGPAPALEIDTQAVNVVAAFAFARKLALVVVDPGPARPFKAATQVIAATPNRRRLCIVRPGGRNDEQEEDGGREILP